MQALTKYPTIVVFAQFHPPLLLVGMQAIPIAPGKRVPPAFTLFRPGQLASAFHLLALIQQHTNTYDPGVF